MTDTELLSKVKIGLGITGAYQDDTLMTYIHEVKNFLIDAGVSIDVLNSSVSVGVIIRGVSDLWNYGMGTAELSTYFIQRKFKLKYINHVLGELKLESSPGINIGTTRINITGGNSEALYRYNFNVKLPNYDEDLSEWIEWDGISEIVAEEGNKMCVAEVTSENLARKAGIITIVANLGWYKNVKL